MLARPTTIYDLIGGGPVYLVAVLGDDAQPAPGAGNDISNSSSLKTMEVCEVDDQGHLACDSQQLGTDRWQIQRTANNTGDLTTSQDSFGIDALYYFKFLYPFIGVRTESINDQGTTMDVTDDTATRTLAGGGASIYRFDQVDPVTNLRLFGGGQSANTGPTITRGYFKLLRLVSYIYVVGGWTDAQQATPTLERHLQ